MQESFNKLFYILKCEQIKEGNGVLRNVVREFNPLSLVFFYFLLSAAPLSQHLEQATKADVENKLLSKCSLSKEILRQLLLC